MSAIAQFTAFTFTAVAALITLTAAIATTQNESITTSGYLLLLGSLLIALATGTSIVAILGFYLTNIILIAGLMLTYALFKRSAEEEVPVTQLIRQLRANIRAQRNPPTFQDRRRHQTAPQGPQPPRKAVQIDRELTYNPYLLYDDPRGIDMDRILQMKDTLTEDEYDQLTLFWDWLRDTGQISSDDTPDTPSGETGRRTYPPTTDEHGRPIIFEDQL